MSRLVLAAGYVLYAAGATCLVVLIVVINSQGARPGGVGVPFLLVVALLSGAAMASVGLLFLKRVRWATAASVTLAASHAAAVLTSPFFRGGTFVSDLPWPRAEMYYVCSGQAYFLPGSLVLGLASLAVSLWNRARPEGTSTGNG